MLTSLLILNNQLTIMKALRLQLHMEGVNAHEGLGVLADLDRQIEATEEDLGQHAYVRRESIDDAKA